MKRRRMAPYRASIADRLEAWSMPEPNSGCTLWLGTLNRNGYPTINVRGLSTTLAHRVAYEQEFGPIPEGLTLDHACRNVACINVAHLEPVSRSENTRRAWLYRERNPPVVTSAGRTKRTSYYDPEVMAWLRKRGESEDRSVDWLVRQILRAAFERDRGAAS